MRVEGFFHSIGKSFNPTLKQLIPEVSSSPLGPYEKKKGPGWILPSRAPSPTYDLAALPIAVASKYFNAGNMRLHPGWGQLTVWSNSFG
jgi:hypothetical protein